MNLGDEVLLHKARIAEKKKRLKDMELRANNYIRIIRDIVDVYGDYTRFDIPRARVTMRDFHKLWEKARQLESEIETMEAQLNG